jgi:hypothetical protein
MSGKHWGRGIAITALVGIVFLFGPFLYILVVSLVVAVADGGAHSEDIGTGQNLHVRKIVTPRRTGIPAVCPR